MRVVDLPDGRELRVRPAAARDVRSLCALFERLGPEDRRRRFFSGFHPDEAFFARLVERPPERGLLLVAEVPGPEGDEVVAEAEYGVLDDGDAEVAITVDPAWRGWLAPYLLDALATEAAARGVGNLRAEVLVENRPMLALVRSRGYAVVETGDCSVVDAAISTSGTVPGWPPVRERPRVLVEVPGAHWRFGPALRADGFDVIGCSGPERRPGGCPLLRGEGCPLVEGADLVVQALGPDDPQSSALLDAHRRAGTRVLVVDVSRGGPVGELPAHAITIDRPAPEEVVALVRSLLDLPQPDRDAR